MDILYGFSAVDYLIMLLFVILYLFVGIVYQRVTRRYKREDGSTVSDWDAVERIGLIFLWILPMSTDVGILVWRHMLRPVWRQFKYLVAG